MDSGFYAALTGLVARTDAFEVAANNLANVSTTGYKAQREFYRALTASTARAHLSPLNRAVNDYGVLGGSRLDLQTGSIERTGNDLDVALEGSAFLAVQTRGGVRYTRNGNLHLGAKGELLTSAEDPVLGEDGPIQIPSGQVSISSDGTISVAGGVVTRLKLADFAPGTQLQVEGNSYFVAPQGSARPATDTRVRQGHLEASNFNAVVGTVGLIALQRQTELLHRALTIFYTDFDQSASQDIPRVQ